MGTFQKIKADLQSVIVETKSHQTAHLLSYAYGFTHISSVSLYVSTLTLNCLIQHSHSEAEYSHRAAVQFMAYVTLNDAHVNGN